MAAGRTRAAGCRLNNKLNNLMHGDEQRPLGPSASGTGGQLVTLLIHPKLIRINVREKLK